MVKLDKQITFIKVKEKEAGDEEKPLYGAVLRTLKKLEEADKLEAGDFKEYQRVYFEWHKNLLGFNPKWDGVQTIHLKQIIAYLNKESPEGKGLPVWEFLLANWGLQTTWIQDKTTVPQINKHLTEILVKVKKKYNEQQSTDDELEKLKRAAGK
jgi:hypothetical protein